MVVSSVIVVAASDRVVASSVRVVAATAKLVGDAVAATDSGSCCYSRCY